jgi:hypothetical protein
MATVNLKNWPAYRKAIVAAIGAALNFAVAAGWGTNQWVVLGIAVATVLGVHLAPNAARAPVPLTTADEKVVPVPPPKGP